MVKRLLNKIERTRNLLKHGSTPNHFFDSHYQNGKISKGDFNKPILTDDEANNWLSGKIKSGQPFLASRFGNGELGVVSNHLFNQILARKFWSDYSLHLVSRDTAWNGTIESQEGLSESFLRAIPYIDGLGVWYNHGEQFMANYLCPEAELFELPAYEPFFHQTPWTLQLEGKKVLVIHPYIHSIPQQYQKRNLIFNYPVLPEFDLQCYKPFSTYNDDWKNYKNAKAALDKMVEDVSALDFDIALVGCGSPGLPLSAAIKKMNKQAIHIGGALQLFFGIIGKRWEAPGSPQLKFVNEHWKRPDKSEIPTDPRVLKFSDNGCYW